MNTTVLDSFNDCLYKEWQNLPFKGELTFPYLITPTKDFCRAGIKVGVFNRETNGWGDAEQPKSIDELKSIYSTNINVEWNRPGSSVWSMYNSLRGLSEGDNPEPTLKGKVGFIQSNVALIGRKYGRRGYDNRIKDLLIKAIDKQFLLLQPDMILLGIGFGTKTNTEKLYLEILEATNYFGKLQKQEPVADCPGLFKLEFQNCHREVYGYRHPQGFRYAPIVQKIKEILECKVMTLGHVSP